MHRRTSAHAQAHMAAAKTVVGLELHMVKTQHSPQTTDQN